MNLINFFRYIFPGIISLCSFLVVWVGKFLEEIATFSKTCVNCHQLPCLKCKAYFEMQFLSPISNFGFLRFRSGLLYRMDKKSELLTIFVIKSIEQFSLDFRVVTKWDAFWMYLYPYTSKWRLLIFFKDFIVRSANADLHSLNVM